MEAERTDQGEGTSVPSSKRPYRRPEIRRLGTVRELTLSASASPGTDANPLLSTKASG